MERSLNQAMLAGLTGHVLNSQAKKFKIGGLSIKNNIFQGFKIGVKVHHDGSVTMGME
jgi:hypothetical protein